MDIFDRYEESLSAYNRATRLLEKGSLDEAEPLLREALTTYPRQALMDGDEQVDDIVRKTFTSLFENIRSRLIEIDRERSSGRSLSMSDFASLQSIVERNEAMRATSADTISHSHEKKSILYRMPRDFKEPEIDDVFHVEDEEADLAEQPIHDVEEDLVEIPIDDVAVTETPPEAPQDIAPVPADETTYEPTDEVEIEIPLDAIAAAPPAPQPSIVEEEPQPPLEAGISEPGAEVIPTPAPARLEPEPYQFQPEPPPRPAKVMPEPDGQLPLGVDPEQFDGATAAAPPAAKDPRREIDRLLKSIDAIPETSEVISTDDYKVSDEIFMGNRPIDEELKVDPLDDFEETPVADSGGQDYAWEEDEEDIILEKSGGGKKKSRLQSIADKAKSFFKRGKAPEIDKRGKGAEAPDKEEDVLFDDLPDVGGGLDDEAPVARESKGAGMGMDTDSGTEFEQTSSPQSGAPDASEEVMSEEEIHEGELTPAEELLKKEQEQEDNEGDSEKKRFFRLPGFMKLGRGKKKGKPAAGAKKAAAGKSAKKTKKGGVGTALTVSPVTLMVLVFGAIACVSCYTIYPYYLNISALTQIEEGGKTDKIEKLINGYSHLRTVSNTPASVEFIIGSSSAKARELIAAGRIEDAVTLLRHVSNEVGTAPALNALLAEAWIVKGMEAVGKKDLAMANNLLIMAEKKSRMLPGGAPPALAEKLARLKAAAAGK